MKKSWILVLATLAMGLVFTSSPALAQAKGYVGATAGLSVPNYDDTSSRLAYGVIGGARLDGELGFGAYFLTSSKEEDVSGAKVDFNYSLYGIEGSFHFEGVADGAYIGLRVGTTKLDIGTTFNSSPTHFGLVFGYDKFLNDNFSLGVEGSWMSIESSSDSGVEADGFQALNFNIAAKAWF